MFPIVLIDARTSRTRLHLSCHGRTGLRVSIFTLARRRRASGATSEPKGDARGTHHRPEFHDASGGRHRENLFAARSLSVQGARNINRLEGGSS
jgi:hypothetical protein